MQQDASRLFPIAKCFLTEYQLDKAQEASEVRALRLYGRDVDASLPSAFRLFDICEAVFCISLTSTERACCLTVWMSIVWVFSPDLTLQPSLRPLRIAAVHFNRPFISVHSSSEEITRVRTSFHDSPLSNSSRTHPSRMAIFCSFYDVKVFQKR